MPPKKVSGTLITNAQGLHDSLAIEGDTLLQTGVLRRTAHHENILSGLDVPLTLAIVGVIAKLLGIYPGRDGLTLASLQRHTGKALQLDGTDGLTVVGTHQVDLCHLVSSHLPCVLHLKGEVDVRSTGRHFPVYLDVVVLEGGVAQSVSERPLHARVLSDRSIVADGLIKFGIGIAD